LGGLVVVLEGLVEVALGVVGASQLIAGLGADRLVLGVMEGVHGELLDLLVVFLVEEVVGQVVKDDRVGRVDRVGLGEEFDSELG